MAILLSTHMVRDTRTLRIEHLSIHERARYKIILQHMKERIDKDLMVKGNRKYEAYLSCAIIIQDLALKRAFLRGTDPSPVLNWSAFYDPPVLPVTDENLRDIFQFPCPTLARARSD